MLKTILTMAVLLVFISFSYAQQEQLTITTYYPSPFGSYRELTAHRMKIGRTYSDAAINVDDDNLLVEGNVGIGTASPLTRLHLFNDGAILAQGTVGSGWTEPGLGVGARLLWYPQKAAFRAGAVIVQPGTPWHDYYIGSYSFATGADTMASGHGPQHIS